MRRDSGQQFDAAFTLIELIVAVLLVLVSLLVVLCVILQVHSPHSAFDCARNLKQIGLSFRLFSIDNSDKFPMEVSTNDGGTLEFVATSNVFRHFQTLSNELSTPKVLICPLDRSRAWATNFSSDFNNSKLSYFVGVDARLTNAAMILSGDRNIANGISPKNGMLLLTTNQNVKWTKQMHNGCGYICFADASIQWVSNSALRRVIQNTGVVTNRLAIP